MVERPALLDAGLVVLDALGHLAAPDDDGAVVAERRDAFAERRDDSIAACDPRRLELERSADRFLGARNDGQRTPGDLRLERRRARREAAAFGAVGERRVL